MISERQKLKIDTFVNIVKELSNLSVASRKKVACMSLKIDFTKIGSMGYNGSFKGDLANESTGTEELSYTPGHSGLIHAEQNMLIKFRESNPQNYIILLTLSPCEMCAKLLINADFNKIYWIEEYRDTTSLAMFERCGIRYGNIEKLYEDYPEIYTKFKSNHS